MISQAIDAVDPKLINPATKGMLHDRLRTELFADLGLRPGTVIVP
jgi:hypothetical protein